MSSYCRDGQREQFTRNSSARHNACSKVAARLGSPVRLRVDGRRSTTSSSRRWPSESGLGSRDRAYGRSSSASHLTPSPETVPRPSGRLLLTCSFPSETGLSTATLADGGRGLSSGLARDDIGLFQKWSAGERVTAWGSGAVSVR